MSPTAYVSAGARVLVTREPPDESGIQRAVANFPVRVRAHVQNASDGLSAKLLRSAPSEEVVADLSEGLAELWLGPGPAWLEIHRGGVRLHRQQVDVPVAGSIDVTVTVASAIVTLQPAKPLDIDWLVQFRIDDGWEDVLTIREATTVELHAGRYRAIASDAYTHGEVAFDVKAGKELTVPLEAQRFELTYIDIPLPPGAVSYRVTWFEAEFGNQTGPEFVLDGSYVVRTQTQNHLRLHGLPRDHPCWVWGRIDDWMLKPTRVVADGGMSHAAEWVRLHPASAEWRLVSPTIYIQFPGSPALLKLSTYAGVPEGPLSLIYEGPSSRTVVQVNEAPITIPEILKQALKQDGQMLSKPPEPPAEDPPSY